MIEQYTIEYIKNSLSQGKTKEELYAELIGQGKKIEDIQNAFIFIEKPISLSQPEIIEEEPKKSHSITGTISIIGSVMIGLGVFSFIAANWQVMSDGLKIAILIISMLSVYAGGMFLESKGKEISSKALIFLGLILYGATIFLIAQIFHMRVNWPDGFILWMLGALSLAYATESMLIYGFASVLGVVSVISYTFIFNIAFNNSSNDAVMTSSLLLASATILTFMMAYSLNKKVPQELKEF